MRIDKICPINFLKGVNVNKSSISPTKKTITRLAKINCIFSSFDQTNNDTSNPEKTINR